MTKPITLIGEILSYDKSAEKNGVKGLALLVKALENVSAFDAKGNPVRDWDALAHFVGVSSKRAGEIEAVKRIINAVFGKQMTLARAPDHTSGYRLNFTDHCAGGKKGAPVWSNQGRAIIYNALEQGMSLTSVVLKKELLEFLKPEEVEKKAFDDKMYETLAKSLIKKAEEQEMNITKLIATTERLVAARRAEEQSGKSALEQARKAAKVIDIDDGRAVAA